MTHSWNCLKSSSSLISCKPTKIKTVRQLRSHSFSSPCFLDRLSYRHICVIPSITWLFCFCFFWDLNQIKRRGPLTNWYSPYILIGKINLWFTFQGVCLIIFLILKRDANSLNKFSYFIHIPVWHLFFSMVFLAFRDFRFQMFLGFVNDWI